MAEIADNIHEGDIYRGKYRETQRRAFFDFNSLRETGHPALELTYQAMERGPVPTEIYYNKIDADEYRFVPDQFGVQIVARITPNLDYFSDYELDLMKRLVEIFAQKWMTADIMSDASHEDIRAWRVTWKNNPNSIIDYDLEFDEGLNTKTEDELTFPEEVYLTRKALTV